MATKTAVSGIGVDVSGALGVAFVVLKLCGVVHWSWLWVLAPFWIPPVVGIVILAAVFMAAAAMAWIRKSRSGAAGAIAPRLPRSVYEPVHGWTTPQRDDYLARNPAYRSAYDAKLQERA